MKKIKVTVSVLLVFTCVLACSACGAKSGDASSEVTKAATEATQKVADVTEETRIDETEITFVTESVPSARASFALYESTIKNYGKNRVESAAEMGYTINTPIYEYAIKDINSDGTDELVIREKVIYDDETVANDYNLSAIYTLSGEDPVELYFISRHGGYFITSDGYFVYLYHNAELEKLVGNELVLVATSERFVSDDYEEVINTFLKSNGVSCDPMEFDFIPV